MQCRNHANRQAEQFCSICGVPLCRECAEETNPGTYHCFQCAMLTSVSEGGAKIKDRRERAVEEKRMEKRKWGPFRYFLLSSLVLVLVMWGVILFGGEKAPSAAADLASNPRAFLFMVDSSLKRYAHYEKKGYPDQLMDLVPKYIPLRKERAASLDLLSYRKDAKDGYRLSLASPSGSAEIVLTPEAVHQKSSGEGA